MPERMRDTGLLPSFMMLFDRDLEKLREEVSLYPDEASLWKTSGAIKNPAGTLTLHLCGNLRHYIGHVLGNSPYRRDRENEFAARNIPKENLLNEIGAARHEVIETLKKLDEQTLENEYPSRVFDHPMTTSFFIIHLLGHLNYHLGQINYHRRLLAVNGTLSKSTAPGQG